MARNVAITELFYAVKMSSLESARNVLDQAKKELEEANKIRAINKPGKKCLELIDEIITAVSNGDIKKARRNCGEAEKGFSLHVKGFLQLKLKEIEEILQLPKDVPGHYIKKPEAHNTSYKSPDRVDDIQHPNDKTNRAKLPKPQTERDNKEVNDQVAGLRQSGLSESKYSRPQNERDYKENDQVSGLRQSGLSENKDSKPQNERDYKEENDQVPGLRQSGLSESKYSRPQNERDYKENDQVAGLRQSGPYENKDSKAQNERDYKEKNDQVAGLRHSDLCENKDSKPTETYNNKSSASEKNGKLERSKLASFRMRQNNPDIADLSDPNRPTKIAERFSELYGNEWTEALKELSKRNRRPEREAIEILLSVVTEAYKFCTDVAEKQIKYITKHWNAIFEFGPDIDKNGIPSSKSLNDSKDGESLIIQYRNKFASKALQRLKQDFTDGRMKQITGKANLSAKPKEFTMYAQKAVELTWWMCVQDPPIFLCPPTEDEVFDKNLYKAYTKTGTKPQFFVWPALRLHKEGVVLVKGVVQFE